MSAGRVDQDHVLWIQAELSRAQEEVIQLSKQIESAESDQVSLKSYKTGYTLSCRILKFFLQNLNF